MLQSYDARHHPVIYRTTISQRHSRPRRDRIAQVHRLALLGWDGAAQTRVEPPAGAISRACRRSSGRSGLSAPASAAAVKQNTRHKAPNLRRKRCCVPRQAAAPLIGAARRLQLPPRQARPLPAQNNPNRPRPCRASLVKDHRSGGGRRADPSPGQRARINQTPAAAADRARTPAPELDAGEQDARR